MNKIDFLTKKFLIPDGLDTKLAQEVLSKRLYENKRISLQRVEQPDDDVTRMVCADYERMIKEVWGNVNYSYIEFMKDGFEFQPSSIKLTFEDTSRSLKQTFNKNTFRVSDSVDLDLFKMENFDNRFGKVTNIYKDLNSRNISVVGAEFRVATHTMFAYGREVDFEKAEVSALLELMERITTYNIQKEVVESSLDSGGEEFINPECMLHYDYSLSSVAPFDRSKSYKWLACTDYKKRKSVYLPLQFFDLQAESDKRFVLETSNGVALGGSPSEAALYGLLELIERDAFLLFWYRQVKLRKINSQTIGKELQEMIDNYETPHTKVHLFDMTIEIQIPTILCLVTSEDSNLASYISTATHINPYIAIKNAIDEAIVGHAIYNTNPNIGKGQYKHYTDVKEMFDHIDFASSTSAIKNYDYITTQKETYDVDDLYGDFKEEYGGLEKMDDVLNYVIQQKMYNHETIYFADLSTPFVTRYNLYSVKAIVPSMLTMSFGYGDARIHKQRLISGIVQSKDYKSKAHIVEGEYYDKPHSFP